MTTLDGLNPQSCSLLLQRANPEVATRLILGFSDQYCFVIENLNKELLTGNFQEAGRLARGLQGVAAMLGAVRLAESARGLEASLQPGVRREITKAMLDLEQSIAPLLTMASKLNRREGNVEPHRHMGRSALAQGCVLIIDDELSMRDLLEDVLQDEYRVALASDGTQGLRLAESEWFDLILLDVDLPGISGHEVLTRLKKQDATRAIPVMFVTGSGDIASETMGLSLGAVDYVMKPINPAILLARVRNQIKLKRAEAEARNRIEHEHYMELVSEFERAALLEETRQVQMKIKDDFLSHVSHELRAPAASIHAFASLVIDGLAGEINAQQAEYLGIALMNVEHLKAMIEDLLEASRMGSGKLSIELSDVVVAEAADYALKTVYAPAERKSIQLLSQIPPNLPLGRCDPTRLRQTLTILLDNAVKFTPAGGSVTLVARVFEQDTPVLLVEVVDTGSGIAKEKVGSVFDRLYQCAEERGRGLGLGLHIAQELVQRQGGQIWVESEIGTGSIFRFTLPISVGSPESASHISTPKV